METFDLAHNILLGLRISLQPWSLLFSAVGVVIGIVIGAIPGIGPTMVIALLVPVTFVMSPTNGLLMMMGIFTGGVFGGSISAILLHIPGHAASVVTSWDGHAMARKGQAKRALSGAIMASVFGGLMSASALLFFSPALATVALKFGPPEYFALALWGLALVSYLEAGSTVLKGCISAVMGLLVASIGMAPQTAYPRFVFDSVQLSGGIHLIPVLIGAFCISEAFFIANKSQNEAVLIVTEDLRFKLRDLVTYMADVSKHIFLLVKCGLISVFIGVLPGAGGVVATFVCYGEAKRSSKHPELFGQGSIEGIFAGEVANNGGSCSSLVPMLTMGIPGSATAAVFLGALTIHGLVPGPMLFQHNPDTVYGLLVGSVLIQLMLLFFGIILSPYLARAATASPALMVPAIIVFSFVGTFGVNNNMFDVWVMLFFGVLGYVLRTYGYGLAPLILGVVLGPIMEDNLRSSLAFSGGSPMILVSRPFPLIIYLIILYMLASPLAKRLWRIHKTQTASRKGL
jgi:putative tricarboxylic transport membrane protein